MSANTFFRAGAGAILLALSLAGCSYDYLQNTDRIAYSAGDAVRANRERETMDPARGSMFDTTGLGANGSLIPPWTDETAAAPAN